MSCSWSVAPADADAAEQPAATPSGCRRGPPRWLRPHRLRPRVAPPSSRGCDRACVKCRRASRTRRRARFRQGRGRRRVAARRGGGRRVRHVDRLPRWRRRAGRGAAAEAHPRRGGASRWRRRASRFATRSRSRAESRTQSRRARTLKRSEAVSSLVSHYRAHRACGRRRCAGAETRRRRAQNRLPPSARGRLALRRRVRRTRAPSRRRRDASRRAAPHAPRARRAGISTAVLQSGHDAETASHRAHAARGKKCEHGRWSTSASAGIVSRHTQHPSSASRASRVDDGERARRQRRHGVAAQRPRQRASQLRELRKPRELEDARGDASAARSDAAAGPTCALRAPRRHRPSRWKKSTRHRWRWAQLNAQARNSTPRRLVRNAVTTLRSAFCGSNRPAAASIAARSSEATQRVQGGARSRGPVNRAACVWPQRPQKGAASANVAGVVHTGCASASSLGC